MGPGPRQGDGRQATSVGARAALSLGRMDVEGENYRRDPPEEGIEAYPEQQERGPSREILLRDPKAEKELQEPGDEAKPPRRVDPLAHN